MKIDESFFHIPTLDLCLRLLGQELTLYGVGGYIVEVEAYMGPEDRARPLLRRPPHGPDRGHVRSARPGLRVHHPRPPLCQRGQRTGRNTECHSYPGA